METKSSTPSQEKPINVIMGKAQSIVNQLEGLYPILQEAVERLGGQSSPSDDGMDGGMDLPDVTGESFLQDINQKVCRIQGLVNQYERQISRLTNLV